MIRQANHRPRGFSLIEVVASTLIVGVVLAVSVRGFARAVGRRATLRDQERAMQYANDLVAEALSNDYQDPNISGVASIGPDSGESGSNRVLFDDVDDYHGWTESPLKSRSGATIANTAGWTRSAVVLFTDANQPDQLSGGDQGVKVIVASVVTPAGLTVESSAMRCRVDKQAN